MRKHKFFGDDIKIKLVNDKHSKDSYYLEVSFNKKICIFYIIFLLLVWEKYGTEIYLTKREEEILTHAANGENNTQISKILKISTHTVKVHLAHVFIKLNVADRTLAVVTAARYGLIDISNIS